MPRNRTKPPRLAATAALLLLLGCAGETAPEPEPAPARLVDTGLFADAEGGALAAGVLSFEPQYPLWTDGATKRRFIALPPGTWIDAQDVDAWRFPTGTRVWKEFSFPEGKEIRFMRKRADGTWLYATYVTKGEAAEAVLAPPEGVPRFSATRDGRHHDVPSAIECRLCHEGGRTPVLGFSALQLSPDRDPLAPNAVPAPSGSVDLRALADRGLVRNLPAGVVEAPPRISGRSPTERAVLGYLHGNCANCHNAVGPLHRLGLRLDYPLAAAGTPPAIASTLDVESRFTRAEARRRVVAGSPATSTLMTRLSADDALGQMPPFGRHLVDHTAAALVERWIRSDLPAAAEAGLQFPFPMTRK